MRSTIRRHALVLALILGTGAARPALAAQPHPAPALPDARALVAGSGWLVKDASRPVDNGMLYRQWRLRDTAGDEAVLFIGASSKVQTALRWSGELGYQGEGYIVTDRGEQRLQLSDGRSVTISRTQVRHLSDRLLLEYATVTPGDVHAGGTRSALRAAWDALWGGSPGPYYTVRVAGLPGVDFASLNRERDRLLATVLSALVTGIGTGSAVHRAR
jgi:hypothetical protein